MIEIEEILYRWLKGVSARKIAHPLALSRNTVKKILFQAQRAGLTPTSDQKDLEGVKKILFDSKTVRKACGYAQAYIAEHHEQIMQWRCMPYMTVTQMVRLFKEQGKAVSETSLRRYVRHHFPSLPDTTVHLETSAGHQGQVDFGFVSLMKDPLNQKMRKIYAFIMTLSHSRYRFIRFVFRQDVKSWIDCHIRAFHFFGGVPETLLIDSLKSGIQKADLYDPIFNRSYEELEKHYGFVCDSTKIRTPRHKGKVERSVPLVRQQILAGRMILQRKIRQIELR